jgi:L-lactate dehydrogenase complex protein LldG
MSGATEPSARDVILARVAEALATAAPAPPLLAHGHHAAGRSDAPAAAALAILPEAEARPWLPDGGATPEESLRLLVEQLGKLRAEVRRVADPDAAAAVLAELARDRSWRRLACHPHPLVDRVAGGVPCATCPVEGTSFDKNALEGCDAGLTACDALVAQTGAILVSSATCGGRALTILPHVHVVVATVDQVVPTLADALHAARDRHGGQWPSMLSFITGPSRTGDIERILVLGAHGPRELIVILVG